MKELYELVELAKKADYKPCRIHDHALMQACRPETILAIAEAFRALEQSLEAEKAHRNRGWHEAHALEQRAEAAEAKLAELEKQRPAATVFRNGGGASVCMIGGDLPDGYSDLFSRPVPAINLAELVPNCLVDAMCNLNLPNVSIGDRAIIGKAIEVLQKIEEAR